MEEVLQLQPRISEWQKQYDFQALVITSDPAEEVRDFFNRNQLSAYRLLLDPQGKAGSAYRVQYIPVEYMVNGDGRIVSSTAGWDAKEVPRKMEEWLQGR